VKAINLLHEAGLDFVLVLVDNSPDYYHEIKKRYEWETVPMIVEHAPDGVETFIGGYTDLRNKFQEFINEEHNEISSELSK
jgi:glutaredoxin